MYTILCRPRVLRTIAASILCSLILEIVQPAVAVALTNGPTQPEFASFEPVSTSNMVNPFTGQFTYNLPVLAIPGPNGSGYALSLSYHSGLSAEEDASWVGYGWTLNPGAVTRMKRGFPDDYDNASVRYWNKVPKNWTTTVGKKLKLEVYSKNPIGDSSAMLPTTPPDTSKQQKFIAQTYGASASVVARYNNYKGFGYSLSAGIDANGWGSLGFATNDGKTSYSASVNPAKLLWQDTVDAGGRSVNTYSAWEKFWIPFLKGNGDISTKSIFGFFSFGEVNRATNYAEYHGFSNKYDGTFEGDPSAWIIGGEAGVFGTYSEQENKHVVTRGACGYMYSGSRVDTSSMDYYDEREGPYNKRDKYLAIPFSNADLFAVNGEGISGGFRLYNSRAGHFYPPYVHSEIEIRQAGGEFHGIGTIGGGVNVGIGHQSLTVDKWQGDEASVAYTFAKDTENSGVPYFFRYNNDRGGSLEFDTDDQAVKGSSSFGVLSALQITAADYAIPTKIKSTATGSRSKRAGYIAYNTFGEIGNRPAAGCMGTDEGNSYYKAYNKRKNIRDFFTVADTLGPPDANTIAEFATINEDGNRYVYGLPVYARRERDYQFGLSGLSAGSIQNNYLAFKSMHPEDGGVTVVGEERDRAYATAYLLTESTTSDYVDRTNDGPSSDDLGGYTLFNYVRTAGTDSKEKGEDASWYKWRTPYRGLQYQRNSLSDPKDDRGTVSYGEKEIYYLESIETKTHIAKFILNNPDLHARRDGFEAKQDEYATMGDPTASGSVDPGGSDNKLRYLDRIELYAKDENGNPGTLISTVRFEYDNSLCWNLPNSLLASGGGDRYGKLTLRRVYFEYGGTRESRVSPYEFGYSYRKSADYSALPLHQRDTLYKDIVSYGDRYGDNPKWENPDYSPFNTDRWGNYQRDGAERFSQMNPWINQKYDEKFDPAAWQLKWIKLPSGGEIQIQYEQNTYRYVQDRDAMFMAPLRNEDESPSANPAKTDDNKYYICLDSLGISDSSWIPSGGSTYQYLPEVELLQKRLDTFFVHNPFGGAHRMYFKFLYSLNNAMPPDFLNCASDYTTGFAKVNAVELDRQGGKGMYIQFEDPNDGAYTHPIDVCQDFVRSSRQGIVNIESCDASTVGIKSVSNPDDLFAALLLQFGDTWFDADECCNKINLPQSYVRIPTFREKKGGGIRVKRLLMYDPGIESGAAALYGTEYLYQTPDGLSSGVATNEPSQGREENALVNYLEDRTEQSELNKIISGRDLEQSEGPLGASILPAPSIGYSRVVIRNIHVGKTGTGFAVNEYYTAKDYPFDKDYKTDAIDGNAIATTEIDDAGPPPMQRYFVFGSVVVDNLYRLQGYRFVLNDMHGQPKHIAAYAGDPSVLGKNALLEEQLYEYFQPGEAILMMKKLGDTTRAYPGKEMEVVMEGRAVTDHTADGSIEMDYALGLGMITPFPNFGLFPSANYRDESIYTHVTTKVCRYPAIIRSVTATKDGITTTTENIAFNPDNGQPDLVRTYDGYTSPRGNPLTPHDGAYYTYTFPASREYPALGQRSESERKVIESTGGLHIEKRFDDWKHYISFSSTGDVDISSVMDQITPGDLVKISGVKDYGTFHVGRKAGNRIELLPVYIGYPDSYAVRSNVKVTIIRSGRSNRVNASVGSITTYGRWPTAVDHEIP